MTGKHPKTGRDLNIDDIRAIKSAMAWRVAVEKGEPSALKVLARAQEGGSPIAIALVLSSCLLLHARSLQDVRPLRHTGLTTNL